MTIISKPLQLNGMQEVRGSIPLSSTNEIKHLAEIDPLAGLAGVPPGSYKYAVASPRAP